MPLSVRLFRDRFPDAAVTLDERLADELLQRLRDGQIDVAFLRSVPPDTVGLVVEVLLTEPMVVAVPRGHGLGKHGADATVAMRDLQNEPFIVFARQQGPAFYDSTLAACQRAGFSPRIAQEAPRVTTALGLVAAGFGGLRDAGIDAAHRAGRRDLPRDRYPCGIDCRAGAGLAQE
jgi:DNA-binding transcriptional LysR family regulator